jgi:hypothetical protein
MTVTLANVRGLRVERRGEAVEVALGCERFEVRQTLPNAPGSAVKTEWDIAANKPL